MPFKPAASVKCPRCDKSVYAAEERAVGELKFHKECYKCSMCNKMLDSTNVNCHETVLYCKTCHGRKFGPKGYGFGGGAAGLSMDTGAHLDRDDTIKEYRPPKAAPGEGCPRCGGKVFAAELMLAKGRSYHRTCFNCRTCRKPLDSVIHCDGPDKEVYCKVCYGKKFGPKGYGYGLGAGTLQSSDPHVTPIVRPHGNPDFVVKAAEGEEACPRCGGKVYNAEQMMAKGRPWHRKCFKCRVCKRPLDSMTHCDAPDGEVYCKLCYAKKYGPKGYGFASGAGGLLVAENIPGGEDMPGVNPASAVLDVSVIKAAPGEGCPRCGGKVFMAEEMNARGRSWHRSCYNCCHCHRPLDSMVGCDAPDGEIYCKLCYAKKYGPKGYGFAAGSGGVLTAENISTGEEQEASKVLKFKTEISKLDVSKIKDEEGKGCPRCGGKVFMAEEMHARGRSWHRRCYNCCHCHRPLDSMVGCDAPDNEIYCKLCYAKKYGPKGYGFAAGGGGVLTAENIPGGNRATEGISAASGAIDTTSILAAEGEGCPRCGGKVFTAEEKLSRGRKWHRRCYNCCECHRPLDSMVACDGPDFEVYCKLCYAKKYGPKGYGFAAGAGGVLFPENISGTDDENQPILESNPAFTVLDVTKIKAKEGQARCPRCGGAVFQAESVPVKGKEWHRSCYNCCECHRPLDSMAACDAPDGEIYCRGCYAKRHGPKGYGYGHCPALVSLGTDDGTPIPSDIRQFGFGLKGAKDWVPPIPHNPDMEKRREQMQQLAKMKMEQMRMQQQQEGVTAPSHWGMGDVQVGGKQVTVHRSKEERVSGSSSTQVTYTQVKKTYRTVQSGSRIVSSSGQMVTQEEDEVVPIVTGVHVTENGEAVPIVSGVMQAPKRPKTNFPGSFKIPTGTSQVSVKMQQSSMSHHHEVSNSISYGGEAQESQQESQNEPKGKADNQAYSPDDQEAEEAEEEVEEVEEEVEEEEEEEDE